MHVDSNATRLGLACDVLVVGAGPAGAVAAATAARAGLSTMLVEAARFPRHRPGEYLTRSAVDFLSQHLGDLLPRLPLRLSRTLVRKSPSAEHVTTVAAAHVLRDELDSVLLDAARRAGAHIQLSTTCKVRRRTPGGWIVNAGAQSVCALFLIDATGGARWLARACGWDDRALSHTLTAAYSYSPAASLSAEPRFELDASGWQWRSPAADTCVTCAMGFTASARGPREQRLRRRDVSWRISTRLADADFAVAGDSAGCVDPAAANGIERAMRSGLDAALLATAAVAGTMDAHASSRYSLATAGRVLEACKLLNEVYSDASGRPDPVGFIDRTQYRSAYAATGAG